MCKNQIWFLCLEEVGIYKIGFNIILFDGELNEGCGVWILYDDDDDGGGCVWVLMIEGTSMEREKICIYFIAWVFLQIGLRVSECFCVGYPLFTDVARVECFD